MKAVHVICRKEPPSNKPLGIFPAPGPNQYTSEAWDFSPDEAEALVGGLIYFHQSKGEKSYFGGEVTAFEVLYREDLAHQQRIKFTLTSRAECRNHPWRGSDHLMAWTSGLIEI